MEVTPKLLEKYYQGQCSAEEQQAIENWLERQESREVYPEQSRLQAIEHEMWDNISAELPGSSEAQSVPLYRAAMRYAATAVILCALGLSAYFLSVSPDVASGEYIVNFDDFRTVETQRAQKRTLTLPDGSSIRLNYETVVKVPDQFEDDQRIVYLSGHAHFDVAKDPDRPFIVYTDESKTQVLGTSFDINTSKVNGETEIIVTSGKVTFSGVEADRSKVTLTPNDRAILSSDQTIVTDQVDAAQLTAWKDNRLVFDDRTLEQVIQVLEPWYDIKVFVKNPALMQKDFRLSMDNPSLASVMESLSVLGAFDYTIEGQQVSIY
ncbi:MAG: FecR domain-containing protein [Bacteroidota bacterium]